MDQAESPHAVVPLEAGAGPDNPPCPACGEPLFGWIAQKRGLAGPVRRCESCGLGVIGEAGDAEAALHELDRLRDGETIRIENRAGFACSLGVIGEAGDAEAALHELDRLRDGETIRIENRAGFACSLGGAGWSGLRPDARYLFTVEAVRRLIARRDQIVKTARWQPGAGLAATWQTLLNSVTFGRNVALGALRGAPAVSAAEPWQRGIDRLASVVLAIPALAIAIPVELAGGPFRRGAVIAVRVELF